MNIEKNSHTTRWFLFFYYCLGILDIEKGPAGAFVLFSFLYSFQQTTLSTTTATTATTKQQHLYQQTTNKQCQTEVQENMRRASSTSSPSTRTRRTPHLPRVVIQRATTITGMDPTCAPSSMSDPL
ncbi:MAG: hypothetical protein J3R72DRAFT_523508 [Linnemannia gamsii]|nr:MAG: hypothetical protein J3R72DRAFT_523508 [Linnemannia gamsii]